MKNFIASETNIEFTFRSYFAKFAKIYVASSVRIYTSDMITTNITMFITSFTTNFPIYIDMNTGIHLL